jgi:uncharacterized membrane protein
VQFVEAADLVLLFLVDVVALLDLHFVGDYQILLVVLVSQSFVFFLPQQLNLTLGVELVDFDSGDFVHNVFQLHLFLFDVVTDFVGLLDEVACGFFDRGVFALLVNQTFIEFFCLGVKFHDVGFHLIHGILDCFLLLAGHLYVVFGVVQGFFETHQLC